MNKFFTLMPETALCEFQIDMPIRIMYYMSNQKRGIAP